NGFQNANWKCIGGAVKIASCVAGFADVNGLTSDGCEVNLNTDTANCGAVGRAVPPPGTLHGIYGCVNGQVVLTGCVTGYFNANGTIVDGCEWAADQYEPNDTQSTATNFGSFGLGGSFVVNANMTPGNDDWFAFT